MKNGAMAKHEKNLRAVGFSSVVIPIGKIFYNIEIFATTQVYGSRLKAE